ncbi:hypothetical protein AGMMS49992_12870 [Clostridia bacterium]|nr:hypothetical protein AGMMS49992_12870 [Clostridia bacterium]
MPSDRDQGGFWQNMFKPGTAACALLCGLLGVAVAVSFLSIGFWKTLLIVACFVAGWIIGRSKALRGWLSDKWERLTHRDS